MKTIITAAFWAGALAILSAYAADEPKPAPEPPLNEISMEVQALRALGSFNLSDAQLRTIAKLAKEAAAPDRQRNRPKESEAVRKTLTELRAALIDDDDKSGDLEEELDKLIDREKPQLDDSFETTKNARARAPEVFKSFSVYQLASYYEAVKNEVVEPLPRLTKLLDDVRELNKNEWRDQRDAFADEIARAVAGLDVARAEKAADKVVALLSKARALSGEEFKTKRAELEKEAQALVGEVGAEELLRNHALHNLAEMLSNPRLEAAIKAKLKKAAADN